MGERAEIRFPEDEGRHDWATDEWWFFCGHLTGEDGREYGLAVSFFPDSCMGVIVDATGGRVLHKTVALGESLRAAAGELDVSYGANWMKRDAASGGYSLHYERGGALADLVCRPTKNPLLLGGDGRIREGLIGESRYYAQTRLAVRGRVAAGDEMTGVTGDGWIDRQWGDWDWNGLGGWEWFSVQLDNGADIAAIRIFHPLTDGVAAQSANVSRPDGTAAVLPRFSARRIASWRSPETGLAYGVRWRIQSPGVFSLLVEAVIAGQEVVGGLWEGECRVAGEWEGERVSGKAYVERSYGRVAGGRVKRAALLAAAKAFRLLEVSRARSRRRRPVTAGGVRTEERR